MAEEKHNQDNKLNSSLNKLVNLAKTEAIVKFARNNLDYAFNQIDAAKKAYDTYKVENTKTIIRGNKSGSIKSIPVAENNLFKITKIQEGVINEAELALKSAELDKQSEYTYIKEIFRNINNYYNEMNDASNLDTVNKLDKVNNIRQYLELAVKNIDTIYTSVSDKLTIAKKNNNKNCVGLALNNGQTQAKRVVIAEIVALIKKDTNGNISSVITGATEAEKKTIKVENKSQKLIQIFKCLDGSFHKVRPVANGAAAIAAEHRYQNGIATAFTNAVTISTGATNTDALAADNNSAAANGDANGVASVSNLLPNMANLNRIAAKAVPASAFPAPANKKGLPVIPNSSQPRESNITQANLNGGRRKTRRNKKSKSQRKRKHTRKH